MIWDKYNDFTLGELLCIVHFSAKRLSFCDSNTVCMLHIESCNTDRAFSLHFALFFFLNTELQTHLCHIVHSWSKLMSVWWLNKPFWTVAWIECDASGVCDTCDSTRRFAFAQCVTYVLLLPNSVLACFIYSYNSLMIFFLRNSVVYLHFKA